MLSANTNTIPKDTPKESRPQVERTKSSPCQTVLQPISPTGIPRRRRSNGFSEFNDKDGTYLKRPFCAVMFVPEDE